MSWQEINFCLKGWKTTRIINNYLKTKQKLMKSAIFLVAALLSCTSAVKVENSFGGLVQTEAKIQDKSSQDH